MNSPQEPIDKREGRSFSRRKSATLKIDMTPMVDLGFLLISFFVITTQLSEPRALNLIVPTDGNSIDLGNSYALTVIPVGNDNLYYYHGDQKTALESDRIYQASYSGMNSLRNVIIEKQKALDQTRPGKEGREGMMLLLKPALDASYKNMVDVLDEVLINDVKKYALVSLTNEELLWLKEH